MKVNKLESPQKTFFFERPNGSIFACQNTEAWYAMARFKLIGTSDGTTFYKAVLEAQKLAAEGKDDEAKQRLRDGEKEELEAARGKIERPTDPRVIEPQGKGYTGFTPK